MEKIIGTYTAWNDQKNDATRTYVRRYTGKTKIVACGPNTTAEGLEICNWPFEGYFPKGLQIPDGLMMVLHNEKNDHIWQATRKLNYEKYPPNEIPELDIPLTKLIYGKAACSFHYSLSFDVIKKYISLEQPLKVCGDFRVGGHYVLVTGFNDISDTVIFNDPYAVQWPDKNGFQRRMPWDEFWKETIGSGRNFYTRFFQYEEAA